LADNDNVSRVEWTELGGDEAETVLANLLYSEHPLATRMRPSRGDFGIDVVAPAAGAPEVLDVMDNLYLIHQLGRGAAIEFGVNIAARLAIIRVSKEMRCGKSYFE
jgi:hypothetical protein